MIDIQNTTNARAARIVVNPASGRGAGEKGAAALQEALDDAGWTCERIETAGDDDARVAAREAAAADCAVVIAVGGDGTLHEVVHGVMEAGNHCAVAHVPTGTTNGVARALGIPLDLNEAVAVVTAGNIRRLDLGLLPDIDRYFLLAVTIGDPSRIVADASRAMKNRWGMFAYYWAAARMMAVPRQTRMLIELDDDHWRTYASGVVVANFGRLENPQLDLFPASAPDDGILDLAVLRARNLWDWLRISASALTGRGTAPRVDLRTARRVRVVAARPRLLQADGEVIGHTPVTIELLPDALRFVAPPAVAP